MNLHFMININENMGIAGTDIPPTIPIFLFILVQDQFATCT